MATEILNNIAILSQKRQEQVSYFNDSLFVEQKNVLREVMEKIEALLFYNRKKRDIIYINCKISCYI